MLQVVMKNPWVQAVGLLILLFFLSFLLYSLSFVLIPLSLAFIVAYVLDPVADILEKKMPRSLAVGLLAIIGIIVILFVPVLLINGILQQANVLVNSPGHSIGHWGEIFLEKICTALGWTQTAEYKEMGARGLIQHKIGMFVKSYINSLTQSYTMGTGIQTGVGGTVASFFSSVGKGVLRGLLFLGNVALFAFVAGYLLAEYDNIVISTKNLIPIAYRERICDIASKIDVQLRSFLRGQLTVCLCLGAMYVTGLSISQTPFAWLIGIFGAFASFIPFVGVVMTVFPALLLTLLAHGISWQLGSVIITFVVAQFLEGNVLTPRIVGRQVGLNPVWVILAVLVFGNLMGFLGLLLAVPMAAVCKVFILEGLEYYKTSRFFKDDSSPDNTSS